MKDTQPQKKAAFAQLRDALEKLGKKCSKCSSLTTSVKASLFGSSPVVDEKTNSVECDRSMGIVEELTSRIAELHNLMSVNNEDLGTIQNLL